ncbi:unnamed protein product, partial [Rotaria sp. Silwood1]
ECEPLNCLGHPCAKCHKCRDWHFNGDQATWNWVCNNKSWKDEDWKRWNDVAYECFTKRSGATCIGFLRRGAYGDGRGSGFGYAFTFSSFFAAYSYFFRLGAGGDDH